MAAIVSTSKANPRSRRWAFTINNWNDEDIVAVSTLGHTKLIYQAEQGDSGTPHIQGCIEFKNARAFSSLKRQVPRAHWSKARDWDSLVEYCQKEDTRIDGPSHVEGLPVPVRDYWDEDQETPWQREILSIIEEEPDMRKIHWFWDTVGGIGKTTLARHICMTHSDAIYLSGRPSDIKSAIASLDIKPRICIFGFTRTQESRVSYQAIEEVKDGMFFSGKYESGMVIFNIPHVIVLSNFHPDTAKLSEDRWDTHIIR